MRECAYCGEPLDPPASGAEEFPVGVLGLHNECSIRMVVGSAAHILHECSCYGGDREDPPGMSRRAAAKLAVETYRMLHPELGKE